ncbi:branched-chain alpha-keto acid dehydrogenase subunit E2 [Staphylococcus aureus]|nr:branched-chain alpha-keto acid dehydrogenase subunit E2 [Staphylococcus aureus]
MAFEFRLPDIGEGIHEGEIVKWFVKAGDTIEEDDVLAEVQNDKISSRNPITSIWYCRRSYGRRRYSSCSW